MNKDVELLKKKDIKLYIDFIKEVFDYEAIISNIELLIKKDKVYIIKDNNKIIAGVVIGERFEYIKNQKYYYLDYLGVLKDYRRKGLATKLFDKINSLAHANDIKYLLLTSGNQRKAAHLLYHKQGFKIKDTTVFIKFY